MILFNPINRKVEKLMSFISKSEYITITDNLGNYIDSQSVPYNKSFEIYFTVPIESLGFKVLFVNEYKSDCDFCSFPSSFSYKNKIHNGKIGVEISEGLITKIFNKNTPHPLTSNIMGYNSSNGGPYIFYPEVIII